MTEDILAVYFCSTYLVNWQFDWLCLPSPFVTYCFPLFHSLPILSICFSSILLFPCLSAKLCKNLRVNISSCPSRRSDCLFFFPLTEQIVIFWLKLCCGITAHKQKKNVTTCVFHGWKSELSGFWELHACPPHNTFDRWLNLSALPDSPSVWRITTHPHTLTAALSKMHAHGKTQHYLIRSKTAKCDSRRSIFYTNCTLALIRLLRH